MLTEYIKAAMRRAKYEILAEDGVFFGEIVEFEGLWASATTLEQCRNELQERLEEWLIISLLQHDPLPTLDGLELAIKKVPEEAEVA